MHYKNKIIVAVVILAVLAGAWFLGGNYNRGQGSGEADGEIRNSEFGIRNEVSPIVSANASNINDETTNALELTGDDASADQEIRSSEFGMRNSQDPMGDADRAQGSGDRAQETGDADGAQGSGDRDQETGDADRAQGSGDRAQGTGDADKYQTSQAPEGRPAPVEPEDMVAGDGSFTISLAVRCDMILGNMNLLDREKHELVPGDGVIFPATTVTAYEGESLFNVLQREMRRAGIHMTFRNTPIYHSAYIEAINNLYEFDVGELSGWLYEVNGWFPNYGCSRYLLQPGDVVEWHYTCDLGRDLGEYGLGAGLGQLDD